MPSVILAINAGSSSVKVSVYSATGQEPKELAQCSIDGLTAPPATLKFSHHGGKSEKQDLDDQVKSQDDAFKKILEHLEGNDDLTEMKSKDDIEFACHRVVHGGDYPRAQVIDKETYHHIEELSDLAPLHNAPALSIVRTCTSVLPNTTNLAFFDTSFHHTLPPATYTYPIDPTIATHNHLRKYGFHGLSYSFILRSLSAHLSKPAKDLNIIALHLGSGASACCIRKGESVDTTMGLTPVSGLPGATRSGDVDPSLIFHYTHRAGRMSGSSTEKLQLTYAEEILNKQSGWKALTGTTDFGKISSSDDENCKLAFDILVEKIVHFIGAYYIKLGGQVDALVFAGGIGEKGERLRKVVSDKMACVGFELDEEKNKKVGESNDGEVVVQISSEGKGKAIYVVKTDEQAEMARGCVELRESIKGGKKTHPSGKQ